MKRSMFLAAALIGVAAFAWAQPQRGQPMGGSPAATSMQVQRQQEMMARMDRVMNQIREMSQRMAGSQVRAELRNINQSMEQTCERLRTMAQRMEGLADHRDYRNDEACCRELDHFQNRLGAMTREMEEAQNALRQMAEWEGREAPGEPVPAAEQAHVGEQQRDMERRMEQLKKDIQEVNAWMVEKQSRKELQETGRDMDQVRDRLQTMLENLIQLRQGGAADRERVREMDRLQDRLDVMMREMMEAHESLTQLANAP